MNNKAKLYLEFLERKDQIPTDELTPLDENTKSWFDALLNHPRFKDLFRSLILIDDYYKKVGENYDSMDSFSIDDVQRLYHPQIGPILKVSTSWDKYKNHYRSTKAKLVGKKEQDFYLSEENFLNYYDYKNPYITENEILLNSSYYPINVDYSSLLRKLNKKQKIDGLTYDEHYSKKVENLVMFGYFAELTRQHEAIKQLNDKYQRKVASIPAKMIIDTKEFKKKSDAYKIVMGRDDSTM